MNERLLVYGSLMEGLGLHPVLRGALRVGDNSPCVVHGYHLIDLGAFPGAVKDPSSKLVGELYSVTKAVLAELDRIEGVPTFYNRVEVAASGHRCWMYALSDTFLSRNHRSPIVPHGDWRSFYEQRRTGRS